MGAFLNPPPLIHQPVVITNDGGGLVTDYEKAVFQYKLEGRRVEIRGSCRSACTLALAVPKVCVGRGAIVKWHQAYEVKTHIPRYDVTRRMVADLPPRVKERVENNIQVNYNSSATLTYKQLVELGVKDCDSNSTVASDRPKEVKVKLMHPFGGVLKWLGWEK